LTAHGLLEQCGGSNADTSLVSAGVPSGSPPDPDLRIDVATCTACPPGQVSDDSGVCVSCPSGESIVGNQCVTCNSDVVISGTTDPFSGTWETSFNNTGLKNCPGWFWLEVRRPDAFFSRGAVGLAAFVHIDAPTQATCAVPYELDFQDSPSINLLKTELVLIKSGTFNGIGQFVPCSGLPIVNIGAVGQLIYGINPIRFGTPIVNGVSMSFDAYLTSPPPQ
jgi:hypothetical protein